MQDSKAEVGAREKRWAVPVGVASILAVVLLIVARPLNVSGDGSADFLREAHDHAGNVVLSGAVQVVAFLLLARRSSSSSAPSPPAATASARS